MVFVKLCTSSLQVVSQQPSFKPVQSSVRFGDSFNITCTSILQEEQDRLGLRRVHCAKFCWKKTAPTDNLLVILQMEDFQAMKKVLTIFKTINNIMYISGFLTKRLVNI